MHTDQAAGLRFQYPRGRFVKPALLDLAIAEA